MKRVVSSYKFYNKVSWIYNILLNWIFEPGRKKIAKQLNRCPTLSVLDIGCGTGEILKHLHPATPYLGLDPSEKMISILQKKFPHKTTCVTTFENWQSTKKYDRIILLYTISTVDDVNGILEKVKSNLKSDGSIYIINHFSNRSKFYQLMQLISINFGYNAYFPINNLHLEMKFEIVKTEPIVWFKSWKLIELRLKDE